MTNTRTLDQARRLASLLAPGALFKLWLMRVVHDSLKRGHSHG